MYTFLNDQKINKKAKGIHTSLGSQSAPLSHALIHTNTAKPKLRDHAAVSLWLVVIVLSGMILSLGTLAFITHLHTSTLQQLGSL